ncbi:LysM domain-containing protein [Candidatus Parcubacteria bacterium]|nr:MAG: LysM domain-containing protein [Candidatus Parcubacteria bacterium]
MKRFPKAVLFVMFLFAVVFAAPAFAQGAGSYGNEDPQRPTELVAPFETYTVQDGDTLWELAGLELDNYLQWREFIKVNPFLDNPGRLFERGGKTIVLIKPGERLNIPDSLYIEKNLVPLSELRLAATPAEASSLFDALGAVPRWVYALLAMLVLTSIGWFVYARIKRLRSDPITSGPAVVPGGVRPEEGNRLRHEFQRMASQTFVDQNPGTAPVPAEQFEILEVVTGRFHGPWEIGYRGEPFQTRLMNGEDGYRARVRFPNGSESTLYSLMACFNPARLGERMFTRGGRFEEGRSVNTAPRPEPTPFEVGGRTQTTFEIKGHSITAPAGSEIRMDGGRVSILPPPGSEASIVVTFATPKKKSQKVAVVPPRDAVAGGSSAG